jgi:osmoprotectant transport system permease protein
MFSMSAGLSMKKRLVVVAVAVAVAFAALVTIGPVASRGSLTLAFDPEFLTRPDGYYRMCEHYGLEFGSRPLLMDPGLMYMAVAEGSVDLIAAFSTDGRIPAYNLVIIEDDRSFFPPYQAAPLVREDTLNAHSGLRENLELLAGRMDDQTMRLLNYRVDEEGEKASNVAREFLMEQGLLRGADRQAAASKSLVVGGKPFTEQEILGEMMAILVEENLGLPVERKLNLGGTLVCFNALLSGDIDLYPEYTGTGLMNILKHEVMNDPDAVYTHVKKEFMSRYNLVWLRPFGFNNTYALAMKRERAKLLRISTISELARHVQGNQEI